MKKVKKTTNKKVRNAVKVEKYGLKFDSKLELFCYEYFKKYGVTLKREPCTFKLMSSFRPNFNIYLPSKKTKSLEQNTSLLRDMTYTPDFIYYDEDNMFIIEVKGMPNDVYPYKRKLLFKKLHEEFANKSKNIWFFEPHTQRQVEETFVIIYNTIKNGREIF